MGRISGIVANILLAAYIGICTMLMQLNEFTNGQVIRAAKSDSRLANNNLPPDIQKLRCRACYEALRFAPRIEAMGKVQFNLNAEQSSIGFIFTFLVNIFHCLIFSSCWWIE